MELVSIVIGTYNGEKYIEEQLKSIIDQTYPELEIIVVDDASNDNTLQILNTYSKNHKNITVHAFNKNVGYIKNFERGIDLAKGYYIALSDQDDWWFPTKIEKQIHAINHYDLVYCDSSFVDENLNELGNSFSSIKNLFSSKNPLNFLIDNCVSGHATLFKKSLFHSAIPFPTLIPHDWWLAYVATLGNGVFYLDEPLVKYRHHQNNVIASNKNKKTKVQKLIERKHRINSFYKKCPTVLLKEKKVILSLKKSYENFSITNNLNRVKLFFAHSVELLKIIKKNSYKKFFLITTMFFKIK